MEHPELFRYSERLALRTPFLRKTPTVKLDKTIRRRLRDAKHVRQSGVLQNSMPAAAAMIQSPGPY